MHPLHTKWQGTKGAACFASGRMGGLEMGFDGALCHTHAPNAGPEESHQGLLGRLSCSAEPHLCIIDGLLVVFAYVLM